MARSRTPELPNCAPMPLKFKAVPCENGDGQPLAMCKGCDGSGSVCKGEKLVSDKKAATPPHTVYSNFTGAERASYQRKGWTITCERCTRCGGAGLVVEGA